MQSGTPTNLWPRSEGLKYNIIEIISAIYQDWEIRNLGLTGILCNYLPQIQILKSESLTISNTRSKSRKEFFALLKSQ